MTKETNTIMKIYGAFFASIIFNFVPSTIVQAFGGILLLIIVIATYIYRGRSNKESLMHSHMVYLIKSFWISSLFLAVGLAGAVALADHSIINEAVNTVASGALMSEAQIESIIMDYMHTNLMVFALTLGPSIIYLAYRVIKGMMLTQKVLPIPNPKNWL